MSGDAIQYLPSSMTGFMEEPNPNSTNNPADHLPVKKKKRNLPGTPDPDAEVIGLSPKTLMATNRFVCEICNKGFQRDQNLQLHRRGHNLPWKLRQRSNKDVIRKRVYICPEKTCVHHDPSRALGDLTGIKKHFSRKHGEKKWKCEKCSKKYAVQSDWKAHSKTCGTREYKCDCGTLFSRKDSFITHRAFCDALAEESARISSVTSTNISFKNDGAAAAVHVKINPQHHKINPHHNQLIAHDDSPNSPNILPGSLTQFHPIFQQSTFGGGENDLQNSDLGRSDPQKPRLSLWMNQGAIDVAAAAQDPLPGNFLSQLPKAQMVSSTTPAMARNQNSMTELVQLASGNLFGSSTTAMNEFVPPPWINDRNSNVGAASNLSLSTTPAAGGKNPNLGAGMASIYSTSTQLNQKVGSSSSHMSATALLQKAAQMGATTSNPSLIRSFAGVISSEDCPPIVPAGNTHAPDHHQTQLNNNSNEYQLFSQSKSTENFNEFMMSSLSAVPAGLSSGNGGSVFNSMSMGLMLPDSTTNEFVSLMMPPLSTSNSATSQLAAQNVQLFQDHHDHTTYNHHHGHHHQLKINGDHQNHDHGLTRDFLGVGDGFSQQELNKFASLRSAMDLSSYTTTTTHL